MASFSASASSSTSIRVTISGTSNYTVFWRLTTTTTAQQQQITNGSGSYNITGLLPRTSYAVNVRDDNTHTMIQTEASIVTTDSEPDPGPSRPDNFYWTHTPVSGQPIGITAKEWRDFTNRINEFREYKGYSNYNFTYVQSGDLISASIVNEAVKAINTMLSGRSISEVSPGQTISAAFFNGIVDNYLNTL